MSQWLVTGGCGFVGLGFINYLLSKNYERIIIFDNLSNSSIEDLERLTGFTEIEAPQLKNYRGNEKIFFVKGDILDPNLINLVMEGVDICIHLAANTGVPRSVKDPLFDFQQNVYGVFNLLNSCRINKIKRFVLASSGAPAGVVEPPIHEELAIKPCSPYGASKATGESYCSAFFHSYGIETVALRFSNVYGPGSHHKQSVVAKFIKECLSNKPLHLYGDGTQTRDFIYLDDLARAIYQASTVDGVGGEIIQIATSVETSINELVKLIHEKLNDYEIKMPPVNLSDKRPGDIYRNFSIIDKAKFCLNWEPKMKLKDGISLTIKSFLK